MLSIEEVREYLLYVKKNIFPEIGKDVAKLLVDKYTKLRQESLVSHGSYRITVRQLESLIRLCEAIARIHADNEVKICYVEEAFRLIQSSVIEIKSDENDIKIQFDDNNTLCVDQSDYQRIMHTFVYILKTKEKMNKDTLILEYLEMREDFLVSENMFYKEKNLATSVLNHLMTKEGVLYEIDEEVYIHPQYEV
ncbi:MCM DNA helicase complex subunit mcm6 [Binucleata daphniae]